VAVAHANGLVLVTLNAADFASFKELEVENWSRRGART
jgi:predicted nucleic acid-binding protein